MQTQTHKKPGAPRPDSWIRLIWNRLRQHLFVKLFAVLLAVFFWMVVIASDPTLTREKVFSATVSVTGADTLRSRGYIVMDDLTSEPILVEMTAQVSQGNYDKATAISFSPRLDLTQITGEGEQEVFFTSAYSTYGEVTGFEPASMKVMVERYITRSRVPVVVRKTGQAPEGLWYSTPTSDPSMVTVSGPASLVDQVRRAVVELPLESLSTDIESASFTLPIKLETADGIQIDSSLITITSESVSVNSARVDCDVLPTREVSVDMASAITGTPAHGYIVGGVSISPSLVTVADSAETLDYLDAIFLQNAVNVDNATESILVTVPLQGASSYVYCSAKEVSVNVNIIPATHTHTYTYLPVLVENLAPGLTARLSRTVLSAVISGAYQDVEGLEASSVHLYVNAEGLEEGVYNAPVQCRVDGTETYDFTPQQPTVTLTITAETAAVYE